MEGNIVRAITDVKAKDFVTNGKLQPNSYSMTKIYRHICSIPNNVTVRLDFVGVSLGDITNDDNFKRLLIAPEHSNVFMRFYNEQKLTTVCQMLLELAGVTARKVLNVEPQVSEQTNSLELVFKETAQTKRICSILEGGIEEKSDTKELVIHYYKHNGKYILTSANSMASIVGLYHTIKTNLERLNWCKAVVDFDNLEVIGTRGESVGDMLHNMKTLLEKDGFHIKLLFKDDKSQRQWNLSVGIAEAEDDTELLQNKIDADLRAGVVGVLTEYVPNENKTDRLGRVGNGKVATRQPAIYLGHTGNMYRFRVFVGSKFVRRADWEKKLWEDLQYLMELGETVNEENNFELKYKDMEIPFEKVGICRYCYGTHYHFSLPIQKAVEDSVLTYCYRKSTKRMENVKILLPIFIEEVLNENSIEYDRKQLQTCIHMSEANLADSGVQMVDLDDLDFTRRE